VLFANYEDAGQKCPLEHGCSMYEADPVSDV
jgi:hypothetical protein